MVIKFKRVFHILAIILILSSVVLARDNASEVNTREFEINFPINKHIFDTLKTDRSTFIIEQNVSQGVSVSLIINNEITHLLSLDQFKTDFQIKTIEFVQPGIEYLLITSSKQSELHFFKHGWNSKPVKSLSFTKNDSINYLFSWQFIILDGEYTYPTLFISKYVNGIMESCNEYRERLGFVQALNVSEDRDTHFSSSGLYYTIVP